MSGESTAAKDGLEEYLEAVRSSRSEASRADRFRDFIRRNFPDVQIGALKGFYPKLEKYLHAIGAGQIIRGRADALFGSLVIEFEPVLDASHVEESRGQLQRYVAAIWSHQADLGQQRSRLTVVATDGISFIIYRPRSYVPTGPVNPEQVILEQVDSVDISEMSSRDVHSWLNRYIITAASELRSLDPDEVAKDFGIGSELFRKAFQLLEKGWTKAKRDSSVLYDQWDSHLRIVYGTAVGSEDLYLRHTYLATLAKLVVYSSYSGGALPVSRSEIGRILDGTVFRDWHIVNFIEEDLFSWVHKVNEGLECSQAIVSDLAHYDLTSVTLDVFKELYQGLVDPEARHELGEYYTPDWLAELIVGSVLSSNPRACVLDPACGSGTFLAEAIIYKKQRIRDCNPDELLDHILETVVGMDVHPLAVLISRATYISSVGRELLEYRTGDIVVPVYMADSIRLPKETVTIYGGARVYSVNADGTDLVLPMHIAEDQRLSDATIDAMKEYSKEIAIGAVKDDAVYFQSYLTSCVPGLQNGSEQEFQALHYTAQNLTELIKKRKDSIWGFVLKNCYKPLFLRKLKFDAVIGNPPWIIYRNFKNEEYRDFLKTLLIDQYDLISQKQRADMLWLMEIAVLFLARVANLYTKRNGAIAFVMPRSVLVADHHHNLRTGKNKASVGIERIVDVEKVTPLFNVPSCVLFCREGARSSYPVPATIFNGRLPKKNVPLETAIRYLSQNQTRYDLFQVGERSFVDVVGTSVSMGSRSLYYDKFKEGARTDPRPLWFVDFPVHAKIGTDATRPHVETSSRSSRLAKARFKKVRLTGRVEAKFLYAVATGSEIVPFGHLEFPSAVLPIEPSKSGYRVIKRDEARHMGHVGLAAWLSEVERTWQSKLGSKARNMDAYDWLDYWGQLTSQSSVTRYKVLYNASGTYLAACVVENAPVPVRIGGRKTSLKGVIADVKTYWHETNSRGEAYYLAAIMNAPCLDKLLKPMQSRGKYGERDIHKKPLEFPIPIYDSKNESHQRLSELGLVCSGKASRTIPGLSAKYRSIGKIRLETKRPLSTELAEIDDTVKSLFTSAKVVKAGTTGHRRQRQL